MGPKAQDAYEKIVLMIRGGQLRPGDKIPSERELLDGLGIGRRVLRQVLARLVTEQILEIQPRKGYFVAGARFSDRRDEAIRSKRAAARLMTCGHDVISQCENCDETEQALRRELNNVYGDLLAGRGALRTLMRAHNNCGPEGTE